MRNIIITTILNSLLLTSTAYATNGKKFYVKMGVGLNQINPIHFQTNDLNGKIKLASRFPLIQIGTGYELTESIRTELSLDHYFLFLSDETSTNAFGDNFKLNYKTKISAAMINAYKDIANYGIFTPFMGGGIGVSLLQDKATGIGTNTESGISEIIAPRFNQRVYRFAYKLTIGTDIQLTENSTFDLSYNYLNLGRNKPRMSQGIIARDYLVHNLTASIRFNL